jgi:hypothetical protein
MAGRRNDHVKAMKSQGLQNGPVAIISIGYPEH